MNPELGPYARELVVALAETIVPGGMRLPPVGEHTVAELGDVFATLTPASQDAYSYLLRALDALALARRGRGFAKLEPGDRGELLRALEERPIANLALQTVLTPLRIARLRELLHQCSDKPVLPLAPEQPRWLERTLDARTFEREQQLEADVAVIGTGAGGGAVAKALAARGHAVLMLEEGGFHGRADFQGDLLRRKSALYRPMTLTVGNVVIPVPTGIGVGGTTTINSGTCFRPPSEVLRRLRFEHGLTELDEDELEPYFARVEAMLEVAPTRPELTSASERVVARGAAALGWEHGPLFRNAPGCDGRGECCFGCPSDAKRSTNVSYVPAALRAGAQLVHHARVERILVEGGRAVGLTAKSTRADGTVVELVVRARAVVIACGTFETPALLLRNGLCNGSGELGKHLTLHPASHAWAQFDEPLEGPSGVPQGHCVEQFAAEGIRLEGGVPPRELAATTLTAWGPELTHQLEHLDRMAFCGFLIRDDGSRGRVSLDGQGTARVSYWLGRADREKLVRGQVALARVFLAAGARTVLPGLFDRRFSRIGSTEHLTELEAKGHELRARDFALSAFHPLGTCRMGQDPARYVVSGSHETHDVKGLFVCDGSAVPGPLGVNPQVTIMALAERASVFVERCVADHPPVAAPRATSAGSEQRLTVPRVRPKGVLAQTGHGLGFGETMRGSCHTLGATRESRQVTLEVSAHGDREMVRHLLTRGMSLELSGFLSVEGLSQRGRSRGTLTISPRTLRRALVYELSFETDAGTQGSFYGEKRLDSLAIVTGMTTLYCEIGDGTRRAPLLRGLLHFEPSELVPWLRSFRFH